MKAGLLNFVEERSLTSPTSCPADESTGGLSMTTAHEILGALRAVSREDGVTGVVGTTTRPCESVERSVPREYSRCSTQHVRLGLNGKDV